MSCLHPIRTCFPVTCPGLDENNERGAYQPKKQKPKPKSEVFQGEESGK